MLSFTHVYISSRVRSFLSKELKPRDLQRFFELLSKLKNAQFDIPGTNVEKLYASGNKSFYSARLNRDIRLIFSMNFEGAAKELLIHALDHHDRAYRFSRRARAHQTEAIQRETEISVRDALPAADSQENQTEEAEEKNVESQALVPIQVLNEEDDETLGTEHVRVPLYVCPDSLTACPERYLHWEKTLDRYLKLSKQQEEILSLREKALLVQGPAGSGKTVLLLFAALNIFRENPDDTIFFFTYQSELASVCRSYMKNLQADGDLQGASENRDNSSGISVFSYIEYCRRYLKLQVPESGLTKFKWIDKSQSLTLISSILKQKPRWSRTYSPERIWGLIYSILKGRFLPGTDSLPESNDDYERIVKDYGRIPDDFAEILEIFSNYQAKLSANSFLDESDLIALSYKYQRERPILSKEKGRLWILIDEIQDFSELEWKSILLLWQTRVLPELPCFPILSGDSNQNITSSGFRWQELESYLASVLRSLHRPNALEKLNLKDNFRNSPQIMKLAAFMRRFVSEAPTGETVVDSEGKTYTKPALLLIDKDEDFLSWLEAYASENASEKTRPLVVLVEDDDICNRLQEKFASTDSVFILSLARSKGMEFEDLIIYPAFSSSKIAESIDKARELRLFDLWYMGVTRARERLIMISRTGDLCAFKNLIGPWCSDLSKHLDLLEDSAQSSWKSFLEEFQQRREENCCTDFNLSFLKLKQASDSFQIFLNERELRLSDNRQYTPLALAAKERALSIWRRFLDYPSLAAAYMLLGNYEEAAANYKLIGKFESAADAYERAGLYLDAASNYERAGQAENAARNYQAAGVWDKAANLYAESMCWREAAESFLRADDLANAAEAFESCGDFRQAANLFRRLNKLSRSAPLFEKAAEHTEAAADYVQIKDMQAAARSYRCCGRHKEAMEIYASLLEYAEAAVAAEESGLLLQAAEFFHKAGNFEAAAMNFQKAGKHLESAQLYKDLESFAEAALNYELAGQFDEAGQTYLLDGNWQRVLDIAEHLSEKLILAAAYRIKGDFKEAAELYLQNNAISEAANCFELMADYSQASKLYIQLERYALAAICLHKQGKNFEAACLYIKASQPGVAFELASSASSAGRGIKNLIAWCRENGYLESAAHLYELKRNYRQASSLYRDCLLFSKAAQCLEKSGSLIEAAELYLACGELEKAATAFLNGASWSKAARTFEELKQWSQAKSCYERCQDMDGVKRCQSALDWF